MAKDITRLHKASGRIVLTAIHRGRDTEGLGAVTAMRWRSESRQAGQDSHVRLVLYIERGGELFIEHGGQVVAVELDPDDRFVRTRGVEDPAADPILNLPSY